MADMLPRPQGPELHGRVNGDTEKWKERPKRPTAESQ